MADVEIDEAELWGVDVELRGITASPSSTGTSVGINQQSGEDTHIVG